MSLWSEVRPILQTATDGRLGSVLGAVARLDQLSVAWGAQANLRVLRNFAVEGIEPFLKLAGYRRGVKLETRFADFDNLEQEILDPLSALQQQPLDLVVVALWLDGMSRAFDAQGSLQVTAVRDHVFTLFDQLKERTNCTLAVNTFLPPVHAIEGWSGFAALKELNREIQARIANDERFFLVDFELLQAELGNDQTFDRRYGFMYQAPLGSKFYEGWAEQLGQAVACLKGMSRKVLVLDCDNTLWGGILGEDGLDGIQLDPHEYPGNAFYNFQRQILELQRTGTLLGLCSKNNEPDVMEVLDRHPHCLIRRKHLAAWRINWQDKATNLRELGSELNLGLDSFVFIDDSPTECGLVRSALPMVETLDLPEKPYLIPSLLRRYTGFRKLLVTREDSQRTEQYLAERERQASRGENLEEYLASLELVAEIGPATVGELARVAQLTQKTNQFNLTTQRYTLAEVTQFSEREDYLVLVMSVADRFGDSGLTGLAILQVEDKKVRLDTFLMSCRILGRRLEDVFLREVCELARQKWGEVAIQGKYRATAKNAQVEYFFEQHGFQPVPNAVAEKIYLLNNTLKPQFAERSDFIKVSRR